MARAILGALVWIGVAAPILAAAETVRVQPDPGAQIAVELESLLGASTRASAGSRASLAPDGARGQAPPHARSRPAGSKGDNTVDSMALVVYAGLLAAGLGIGFGLGLLRNQHNAQRARDLAARLEKVSKECELARQELDVARDSLRRLTQDYDAYRGRVTDHFAGTSDRLRELAIQYRAVYQHLAEGASALCPEGFKGLEGGLELLAPPAESQSEDESDPERIAAS